MQHHINAIILPRQARDKCTKNSKQTPISCSTAVAAGAAELMESHISAWAVLWDQSAIEVEGDELLARAVWSAAYPIVSSIRADWGEHHGLSPGGLFSGASPAAPDGFQAGPRTNYLGHVFWDCEVWSWPALLPGHPDLAAAALKYREQRLDRARAKAAYYGWGGAMFPWESAVRKRLEVFFARCYTKNPRFAKTGSGQTHFREKLRKRTFVQAAGGDMCPCGGQGKDREHPPHSENSMEIHINSDISLATSLVWKATANKTWLAEVGAPLAHGIAEFWASRVSPCDADIYGIDHSKYCVKGVMGPDESHAPVDDSPFTSAGAQFALRWGIESARIVSGTNHAAGDNALAAGAGAAAAAAAAGANWSNASDIRIIYDPKLRYHPQCVSQSVN